MNAPTESTTVGGLVWEQTPHSNKTTRWALRHDGTRAVSWYSPGDGTGSELTRTLRQGWYCSILDADPRSIAGPFPTEEAAQTLALFLEHKA